MEELVAKYLADELSEKERTDFELKLIQNEEFSLEFEAYLNAWSMEEPAKNSSFNTAIAWNAVSRKILSEPIISKQSSANESFSVNGKNEKGNGAEVIELPLSGKKPSGFSFLKIAATLLVLAVAGYFVASNLGEEASQGVELAFTNSSDNSFTLPDGTLVTLNADSRLSYDKNFGVENRNVILVGQADFDVTRNENLPFIIEAGQSKIEVLGTSFDIAAYPGKEAKLMVTEGRVAFTSLKKADVKEVLIKGQQATLDIKGEKIEVTKMPEAGFDNTWLRDFQFENAPLAEIFKRIEKAYQVKIIYPDAMKNCRWTHDNEKNATIEELFGIFDDVFPNTKVTFYTKENQIKLEGTACDN